MTLATIPGLTCASCHGPLYPDEVRRTEDGWKHALSERRRCLSISLAREREEKRRARAEDLRWMAETGECFGGAAKRLGISRAALERWLRLNPMPEVSRALLAREPVGANPRKVRAA